MYGLRMGDVGLNVLTGTATSSLGRSTFGFCDLRRISKFSNDVLAGPVTCDTKASPNGPLFQLAPDALLERS